MRLLLVLSIALLAALASADSHDHSHEHGEEIVPVRTPEAVLTSSDSVRITSSAGQGGKVSDQIGFDFESRGCVGLEGRFRYRFETRASNDDLKFAIRFVRLWEFNTTETFDRNNTSTHVRSYNLGGMDGCSPSVASCSCRGWNAFNSIATDAVTGVKTTQVSTVGSVFALTMHIAPREVDADGVHLSPNKVKLDVNITNFPYRAPVNQSRLALEVRILSRGPPGNSPRNTSDPTGELDESTMASTNNALRHISCRPSDFSTALNKAVGVFEWSTDAHAGTAVVPVVSSRGLAAVPQAETDPQKEGRRETAVFFTFQSDSHQDIYWDPEIGVDYTMSAAFPLAVSHVFVLGCVGLAGMLQAWF